MRLGSYCWILILTTTAASGSEIWESDFVTARDKSIQDNKPLLVQFGADWCTYCVKMERTTFRDEMVKRALKEFVAVHVDVDETPNIATSYKATRFPTTLVLNPAGQVIHRLEGYRTAAQFVGDLDKVMPAAAALASHDSLKLDALNLPAGPNKPPPSQPQSQPPRKTNPATRVEQTSAVLPPLPKPRVARPYSGAPERSEPPKPKRSWKDRIVGFIPGFGSEPTEYTVILGFNPLPDLALDGFCPVSLVQEGRLRPGHPDYHARFSGKTYWLSSPEQKRVFSSNPEKYVARQQGNCIHSLVSEDRELPGKPEYSVIYHGQLYMFSSLDKRDQFRGDPARFLKTETPAKQIARPNPPQDALLLR